MESWQLREASTSLNDGMSYYRVTCSDCGASQDALERGGIRPLNGYQPVAKVCGSNG